MQRMFNPPHPGRVLRDALGDMDVTTAAKKLHVSRTTLSRILQRCSRASPQEMSIRPDLPLWGHMKSLWYRIADGL